MATKPPPNHALAEPIERGQDLVLTFGMVTIPVKLHGGIKAPETLRHGFVKRKDEYHETGSRPYDKVTGQTINRDEIVRMAETEHGWVELTDEELENAVTEAGCVKGEAEIVRCVPLEAIGKIYLPETYLHVRGATVKKGRTKMRVAAIDKALALLLDALAQKKSAAIFRVGEKWAALLPDGRMARLRFADEVRQAPVLTKPMVSEAEVAMAVKLLDTLPDEPLVLRDDVGIKVQEYLSAKAGGSAVVPDEADFDDFTEAAEVVDLMAVLEASVEAATGKKKAPAK
jgi:DNA end-binding protein Ku